MLIQCPECSLQISDKAISCPHCGYCLEIKNELKISRRTHKKLPNGFGQITKIKNKNLRKPFRAMITVGKDSTGHPIAQLLRPEAYFKTYNEAYNALTKYNQNPYDLNDDITVQELYEKWSDEYFEKLKSEASKRTITSAWAYCTSIYDMRVKDVRARHMKGCMDNGTVLYKGKNRTPTANTKTRIKSVFNLLWDYAVEYELADKNYARTFNISDDVLNEKEDAKRSHIPFTEKEIEVLWSHVNIPYVNIVLIQCYSGWRPQELGLIKLENVDLEHWTFMGGMKTKAGTNRIVPIHTKIRPLVKRLYDEATALGSDYFINCVDGVTHTKNKLLTYDKYQKRFIKIRDTLGLNPEHRAHDGRVHFVTQAKRYGVDEYAIKYIVGHSISDITESVYTKRDLNWLMTEIEKIK